MEVIENIRLQKRKLKSILLNLPNVLISTSQSGSFRVRDRPGTIRSQRARVPFILTGISRIRGNDTAPMADFWFGRVSLLVPRRDMKRHSVPGAVDSDVVLAVWFDRKPHG